MQPPAFTPAFRDSLQDLLAWRRDVRAFRREPLADATVERLLETACLAPSVGLSEPWRFVLVDDPGRRAAVRASFCRANAEALAAQPAERQALYARLKLAGLDEAPVHLAAFADPGDAQGQGHGLGRRTMPETVDLSVAIAVHTLWLAARAEGIGLGWVSILEPDAVARIMDVPLDWHFVGYLCLGYPAEEDRSPALQRAGWERRRDPACRLLRR